MVKRNSSMEIQDFFFGKVFPVASFKSVQKARFFVGKYGCRYPRC